MKCRAVLPLLAVLALGCLDADPVQLASPSPIEEVHEDLAAFSGHPAEAHADDYPIHIQWITGEPEWEPLRLAVEAAARRWSHIIAPTPTAPYTFRDDAECGHPRYGWLGF